MTGVPVMLDVAHNPDSIDALVYAVQRLRQPDSALDHGGDGAPCDAVMADKDVETMLASLVSIADIWYIAQVEDARCLPSIELSEKLKKLDPTQPCVALMGLLRLTSRLRRRLGTGSRGRGAGRSCRLISYRCRGANARQVLEGTDSVTPQRDWLRLFLKIDVRWYRPDLEALTCSRILNRELSVPLFYWLAV